MGEAPHARLSEECRAAQANHDVARRIDCGFLARLVAEHRLGIDDAAEVAVDLTYRLVKAAYHL
jgi:glucuronate isomerase